MIIISSTKMLSVFIAEDSQPMIERLIALMEDIKDLKVIGRTGSVRGAVELISDLRPDVAVIDVNLTDGSAIDALSSIKNEGTSPTVIMISIDPHPERIRRCIKEGADYFFDKSCGIEDLIHTLENLCQNKAVTTNLREVNSCRRIQIAR